MKKPTDQRPDTTLNKSISEEVRRNRRRALLKSISGVGALSASQLPQQWARPIVDQVLLPVHASGSPYCAITCTVIAEYIPITTATIIVSGSGAPSFGVTIQFSGYLTCFRLPDNQTGSSSTSNEYSQPIPSSNVSSTVNIVTISGDGVEPSLCAVPITNVISNGPPFSVSSGID